MAGDPVDDPGNSSDDPGLASAEPDHDPASASEGDLKPETLSSPLAYAHAGRRRKRITEDLFRCKLALELRGEKIQCNALIWRQPDKMREHLVDHMSELEIQKLTDKQVRALYIDAALIPQEGIPTDDDSEY